MSSISYTRLIIELGNRTLCDIERNGKISTPDGFTGLFFIDWPGDAWLSSGSTILAILQNGLIAEIHVALCWHSDESGVMKIAAHSDAELHLCKIKDYNLYRRTFRFTCQEALGIACITGNLQG